MTPDPVTAKLSRFTPNAALVDPAELLFAAGRASARTPWFWKVAVAGLALGNLVCLALLLWPAPDRPAAQPGLPASAPTLPPLPPINLPTAPHSDDPWSYRMLIYAGDPERFPRPAVTTEREPTGRPLSVLGARRGDID